MAHRDVPVDGLPEPVGHYANVTVVDRPGRLVFISGMTAKLADGSVAGRGDVGAQTRVVCEKLKAAVEAAGGTIDDICRVDVFVRSVDDFDAIHAARREFFVNAVPASTMVEVSSLIHPDYLIEINAIAVVQDSFTPDVPGTA